MGVFGRIVAGAMLLLVGAGVFDFATFDRAAWKRDYAAMKVGMAQHYANLDWARDARQLDLAALDRRTQLRLDRGFSHIQGYFALRRFVEAFDDPHLALVHGRHPRPGAGPTDAARDPPAGADCAAAGYRDSAPALGAHVARLPGWRQLGGGAFPHGVAGRVGVLRIASFGEQDYLPACLGAFRPGIGSRALQLATRAELQTQLIRTLAALRHAGATHLVVDLTGNGGGSEWDREAAALFTAKPMRRAEPRIANAPCDRSTVWSGGRPCAVFATAGPMSELRGTGEWGGELFVLADANTASAAEEFIGWLKDNGAARLVGARTMGAGCGYVDGGNPVVLKAAPLTLNLPNCARYTAAGTNEIEGWTPDVPLPDAATDPSGWARELMALAG